MWSVALLALLPAIASAQTRPTFSVSITEPFELVEAVGTTRRIDRTEIEARNARTLDEALRLLPGIYVRTGGDGTPRIDVRGFRSRHVLLLVNGVPLNSTVDGQFDPARISTEAIREIKVTYGTSSVLYGDNALAAVIEITTVDDTSDAALHVSGGTPGQGELGGHVLRTYGNWSLSASGSGYTTDGFRLPESFTPSSVEDGGRRQNSDRDRGELRAGVGYRFSSAVSVRTEWSFGTGSHGVPTSTIDDASDIFAQPPRFERVEDYRTGTGQISMIAAPWQRFNLRAWVFRNTQREDRARYDDASYSSMDDPLVSGTFRSRERTTVTGSSALARMDLERFGWLRVAFTQRREDFDSHGMIRDVAVGGGTGGGGGGGRGGGGGSRPQAFDVRSFSFGRHVDVFSTGVEWQFQLAKPFGTVLGVAANHQQRPDADGITEPTWLAGVSFDATGALRLYASAARKVRVPSIDQLFNVSTGNPSLRAEHAYTVEVGTDYRVGDDTTFGVTAFSTHARDFIERISGSPFENQDRYRFGGGEIAVHTTRIPRLDLRGAYSFLDSADITVPDGTRRLQTRPRHRGSLAWILTPVDGSEIRGAVYRVGTQLYDSRGAAGIQLHADAYTVVDVGFTQRILRRWEAALDLTNVFDNLYDQGYALPREGRAAVLTLRVNAK